MTDVACFNARTALPELIITSTFSLTNSAAISAKRSDRPSAHRYSIATVRPSIQPSSPSRWTKAVVHWLQAQRVPEPKTPTVGSWPARCARTRTGRETAAPPSRLMNSLRLMGLPRVRGCPEATCGLVGAQGVLREPSGGDTTRPLVSKHYAIEIAPADVPG